MYTINFFESMKEIEYDGRTYLVESDDWSYLAGRNIGNIKARLVKAQSGSLNVSPDRSREVHCD